eukprot:510834-Pleurochrysis_carterae.AAC.1
MMGRGRSSTTGQMILARRLQLGARLRSGSCRGRSGGRGWRRRRSGNGDPTLCARRRDAAIAR